MKRTMKQALGLSVFAAGCLAVGMGLSYHWVAQAEEDRPVSVNVKSTDGLPPIAEVAEKLNPTVVSITNTSYVKQPSMRTPFGNDPFFDFFFSPRQPNQPRGQQDEQRVMGGGSGVIIGSEGEILTNHHVIEGIRGGDSELEVKLSDGRTFKAKVLGKDKELDIALIRIEAAHLPFAALGDSDKARVGEWVVAIGNPLGLDHTVTQGIISAKGRTARALGGPSGLESFLQTDAAINRGNSGGPLLNLRGEVIGINTAIRADGQNIGFAVPINMVKRVLRDLRSGRPVSRGFLGVATAELDKAYQDALNVKQGVVVADVTQGQAADKAKVARLDVITAIDGQSVSSPDELVAIISGRRAGDTVKLSVVREGKRLELPVVLGDRKNLREDGETEETEESGAQEKEGGKSLNLEKRYGFEVAALDAPTRHQYQIAEDRKGVVVTRVAARSEAANRLRVGNVISAVGTKNVNTLAEFNAEVRKLEGKPLLLFVRAPQGNQQVTVAIPPR
ncbi:MAG: trypsin-like peptidase domain-containing protein [Firmicutes bacterium]|nr:trypsin-like peptidase domain-containing protein [Bacillota bacterium]